MNAPRHRELFHHRSQEIIRQGDRKVVSLSSVTWNEISTMLPDDRGQRKELQFVEGSLSFRQGSESIGRVLKVWEGLGLQISLNLGKRPHVQWIPSGPPVSQRALAISLAADLGVAWLRPALLGESDVWTPPPPREQSSYFINFKERVEASPREDTYRITTHFSFTHREPPGTERGDSLSAKGITNAALCKETGCLLEARSETLYFRFGKEVGVDLFRLGPDPKPFSWS